MAVKLIGNLNQYGKLLKMQQQWSAKKADPKLITSKADLNTSLIEAMKPKEQEYTQEEIQKKVEDMKSKLRSGGRLSPKEKEFLAKNAPEVYRDVVEVEKEREAFTARLRACKTKQEAESVKTSQVTQILASTTRDTADLGVIRIAQMDAAVAELGSFLKELPEQLEQNTRQEDAMESAKTERRDGTMPDDIPTAEEIAQELAAQLGGIQFTPQLIEKIASYVSVPVQENASTNNSVIFSSGRAAYCAAAETPAVEDLPEPSHFHRKA